MSAVTGISGIQLSAASAAYAPTNSATVSAIASSYAESAVSSKLDSSASSSFYTTANESGFMTGLPTSISATRLIADSVKATTSVEVTGHVRAFKTGNNDMYGNFDYAGMYFRSGAQRPYNIGIDSTGSNFYIATAKAGYERIYASSIQNWNGKADSSALSSYALSSDVSGVIDTVSTNSASWGGVDSATVSAIASSYAESAASSKMDSSAIDYTRTGNGTQIYASGTGSSTNQFSAKNDSAGAAIIAGENARLRLWDTAATANLYASSIGGWNAASNLVSTQSANWGGSALQLSAGPGVSLEKVGDTLVAGLALSAGPGVKLDQVGDTLVASTDETLLWSGNLTGNGVSGTASEAFHNFDNLKIYGHTDDGVHCGFSTEVCLNGVPSTALLEVGIPSNNAGWGKWFFVKLSGDVFNNYTGKVLTFGSNNWGDLSNWGVTKIVGINRTAGV